MYTSTVLAATAAIAGLVSAAPGTGIPCPNWVGREDTPTRAGGNQCCRPNEPKNQLNCCYTSGRGINSEQLLCSSPFFATAKAWTSLQRCNTRQVPQTACNGIPKMPEIMAGSSEEGGPRN